MNESLQSLFQGIHMLQGQIQGEGYIAILHGPLSHHSLLKGKIEPDAILPLFPFQLILVFGKESERQNELHAVESQEVYQQALVRPLSTQACRHLILYRQSLQKFLPIVFYEKAGCFCNPATKNLHIQGTTR
jgi:hypothetical protein